MKRDATSNLRKKQNTNARSMYWWPITETKIRQAAQKIAAAAHPEKIILFGSFAHGNPTPDSDVDLLVIMASAQDQRANAREISEILYPRPFPVDILVRTPAEIAQRLQWGDGFISDILAKGKVLYERSSN